MICCGPKYYIYNFQTYLKNNVFIVQLYPINKKIQVKKTKIYFNSSSNTSHVRYERNKPWNGSYGIVTKMQILKF